MTPQTRHALFRWRQLAAAALLLGLAWSAQAWSNSQVLDLRFPASGATVQGELIDQLARLNCRLAGRGLEFALVQAQVVTPGPRAAGLAQARAQAVKQWLVTQHGWDAARIVLQPLKDSPAGSVPWVTVEVTPRMDEYQPADCSLLRTGWITDPARLHETALAQQRGDVVDALDQPDSGIRLTPEQQAQVARLALQHGALTRFQTWLDAHPSQALAPAADWHVRVSPPAARRGALR